MNIPKINIIDLSNQSQYNRLISIYKNETNFEELSNDDKKKVKGAYSYLKNTEEGKKYIPNYVKIDDDKNYHYVNNKNYKEVSYKRKINEINVEGYRRLILIHFSSYLYGEEKNIQDIDIKFLDEDNNTFYIKKENMEKIKKFIETSIDKEVVEQENIELDEYNSFVISKLNVRYDFDTKNIQNINLNGYFLMKNL